MESTETKTDTVPKLTREQGLIITGYTGVLACDFADFHEDVEKRLGRPIFTHEFASKELREEIHEAYQKDFVALVV
jgi:hypothetical protein